MREEMPVGVYPVILNGVRHILSVFRVNNRCYVYIHGMNVPVAEKVDKNNDTYYEGSYTR